MCLGLGPDPLLRVVNIKSLGHSSDAPIVGLGFSCILLILYSPGLRLECYFVLLIVDIKCLELEDLSLGLGLSCIKSTVLLIIPRSEFLPHFKVAFK